jgi:hypothetical protein
MVAGYNDAAFLLPDVDFLVSDGQISASYTGNLRNPAGLPEYFPFMALWQ